MEWAKYNANQDMWLDIHCMPQLIEEMGQGPYKPGATLGPWLGPAFEFVHIQIAPVNTPLTVNWMESQTDVFCHTNQYGIIP